MYLRIKFGDYFRMDYRIGHKTRVVYNPLKF